MEKISTPFGDFNKGDKVKVVNTLLLGEVKEIEGTLAGERLAEGVHFISVKTEEGILEFPMSGGFVSFVEKAKEEEDEDEEE